MATVTSSLLDDGRFAVGDELLVFAYQPPDGGAARPIGTYGDGVFIRRRDSFAWTRFPRARFNPRALMAYAHHGGNLYDAAETLTPNARLYMGPPPVPPKRTGCAAGDRPARSEAVVAMTLLLGLLRVRPRSKTAG